MFSSIANTSTKLTNLTQNLDTNFEIRSNFSSKKGISDGNEGKKIHMFVKAIYCKSAGAHPKYTQKSNIIKYKLCNTS